MEVNNDIFVRTRENVIVLTLSHFKFNYNDVIRRVTYKVGIQYEIFRVDEVLEAEEDDFLELRHCLIELISGKRKTCAFYPLGDRFRMQFDVMNNGHIEVGVVIKNILFTGELTIKFVSDMSFLPSLVDEIEKIFLEKT